MKREHTISLNLKLRQKIKHALLRLDCILILYIQYYHMKYKIYNDHLMSSTKKNV
jgi:hypothetical protein